MKSFYEFLMEYGYDSWKLASPPDWDGPDWDDNDLEWSGWEDNSESVWLVNDQFVDSKKRPIAWLQPWLEDVKKWGVENHAELPWNKYNPDLFKSSNIRWPEGGMADHSKSLSVDYKYKTGRLRGGEDPKTGDSWDPVTVRVEIESPFLTDYKNKVDLSDALEEIKKHYYPDYE